MYKITKKVAFSTKLIISSILLLALALVPALGCQLGSTTTTTDPLPTDPGSPLGTQSFTITTAGTDGVNTARHTYQYQVTIQ